MTHDHTWPFDVAAARAHLVERDPRLGRAILRLGPLRYRRKAHRAPFRGLLESIVYQQLSGRAAATILGRVVALFPPGRFPTPEAVLAVPEERLRGAGLSRAKVAAIRDLALRCLDGTVPRPATLRRLEDEAVIDRLTAVRGVGRWTAEMYLIFRLGRPDVFPVDDLGVRKGFRRVFGGAIDRPERLVRRAERWRPFRSVATCYLWQAADGLLKESAGGGDGVVRPGEG